MEITAAKVLEALSNVVEPDLKKSITELELVEDLKIDGNKISFKVKISNPAMHSRKRMEEACKFQIERALGKDVEVEKVEVIWPDGKTNVFKNVSANIELTAKHSKAKNTSKINDVKETLLFQVESSSLGLAFTHKENRFDEFQEEILLPHNISQNGPFTAVGDVNGDNLEDIFVGGAVNQSGMLYLQNKEGGFDESKSINARNSLAFGVDIETGGHVFQLILSNAITMIEKSFIAETTDNFFGGDIHLGFNISRTF